MKKKTIVVTGGSGRFGEVLKDECTYFVSFHGSKNRDTNSAIEACQHHFAQELNNAKSSGFLMFGDSAPEYKKACKKLKILHRAATPNSDEANARHERFIGIFGDLIRSVL